MAFPVQPPQPSPEPSPPQAEAGGEETGLKDQLIEALSAIRGVAAKGGLDFEELVSESEGGEALPEVTAEPPELVGPPAAGPPPPPGIPPGGGAPPF